VRSLRGFRPLRAQASRHGARIPAYLKSLAGPAHASGASLHLLPQKSKRWLPVSPNFREEKRHFGRTRVRISAQRVQAVNALLSRFSFLLPAKRILISKNFFLSLALRFRGCSSWLFPPVEIQLDSFVDHSLLPRVWVHHVELFPQFLTALRAPASILDSVPAYPRTPCLP